MTDHVRGWHKVELEVPDRPPRTAKEKESELPFPTVTISSDWGREYAADGHHDHGAAATFKLETANEEELLIPKPKKGPDGGKPPKAAPRPRDSPTRR